MYKDWGNKDAGKRLALYADKKFDTTPENRVVNYKLVFKIWSK